ncbi:DsrE family protein [Candidatus Sulfurimonas marisnigri]|uniref:DsrE family protein n=1 Tax=Candidatus Sulfurimonas marisnigri TaxID=2740405 RepID=A0A7S7M060_9BACT|nr:DsrE family protein [Candidatus Sulfurimonas marisnigri]QOY54683.1 DsrE family protein [Candidatus Sulfurimonas marisnigri]
MKYIFLALIIFSGIAQAKEYKAIFDCSSKNSGYIVSRMFLVERTMDMIEKNGDTVKFALTIHGSCAPIVSKNIDEVIMDENNLANMQKARKQLERLATKKGIDVTVCAMSLNANTIDKDDVLPFVKISENSFIDTIGYQNDGYALMTFK